MSTQEHNIGDKVWWVKYRREPVKKTCPICFGRMRVKLILGDESIIETDCTYCERGYQKFGWVEEYEYVSAVEQVTLDGKEVREYPNGRIVEYHFDNYRLDNTNIFLTKEEADSRLLEMIAEEQKKELERRTLGKDNNPKKYSWDVGYYQRKKRKALEEIEMCDRKITHFKKKAKEEKNHT